MHNRNYMGERTYTIEEWHGIFSHVGENEIESHAMNRFQLTERNEHGP